MDLIKHYIKVISGGSVNYSSILFDSKRKPNTKFFEYLLYLDSIHDFPKLKENLLKKIDGTKISDEVTFNKDIKNWN